MAQLTIRELGRQGDGIADGPIFVARTLPGEVVEGDVQDGGVASPRIVTPSEDRISPACKHFKTCGGCRMQHASDPLLALWKTGVVKDALKREGLDASLRDILTTPPRTRRRAKFAARRTKSGAMAGFRGRGSHTLVDVVDCHLITSDLAKCLPFARAATRLGGSRKGEMAFQTTATPNGLDVAVSGGKPLDDTLRRQLPQLATEHDVLRLTWDGELVAQSEPPLQIIGQAKVNIPPGAFLQATMHAETALQASVREIVQDAKEVADLFSGCGTFALDLAQYARVRAFEGDKSMTRACQDAANNAGLRFPIKAVTQDLFQDPVTSAELNHFDAVVLDPPRAGALAQCKELAKSEVATIAYVSCDPTSFARDVSVLVKAGFSLDWVQPVDQFRWSAHVELAAKLTR